MVSLEAFCRPPRRLTTLPPRQLRRPVAEQNDLQTGLMNAGAVPSIVESPWVGIVDAARYAGYRCPNGRAPGSFYVVAQRIGHKLNGQWRFHRDDLDEYIRGQ